MAIRVPTHALCHLEGRFLTNFAQPRGLRRPFGRSAGNSLISTECPPNSSSFGRESSNHHDSGAGKRILSGQNVAGLVERYGLVNQLLGL